MARKKKVRSASQAESFAIENNLDLTDAAISQKFGIEEEVVRVCREQMTAQGVKGPEKRTKLQKAGFTHDKSTGVVSATPTSTMNADELYGEPFDPASKRPVPKPPVNRRNRYEKDMHQHDI